MATRRERVVLELEDRFTSDMARAAAATALLNRELGGLSKDSVRTKRSMSDIDDGVVRMGRHADTTGSQLDKLSGRVRILADVAAILGPSLVPIGGVGIAAISGLASQFGFAALGAGTAVLAFQGVGDALKAVNKAAIEPTAANLEAARVAMDKLGPSGREFVAELQQMIPKLKELQVAAADGLLPGAADGLESLIGILPRVERIVSAVSSELGQIAADTGESLASERWEPFLDFLAQEAPKALADMASIAGNTGHALAELWMAFTPLDNGFSQFLVDSSADLDRWAQGLSQTQGFQDFVAYIQETGPQVAETFAAIANATIQIVEAAAPLGGPVLQGVTALANAVASIADSDLGTPIFAGIAALALMNRTLALTGAMQKATFGGPAVALIRGQSVALEKLTADWRIYNSVTRTAQGRAQATAAEMAAADAAAGRLGGRLRNIAKGTAVVGGLAVASTGAADGLGLTNTASLALLGTMGGAPGVVAGGLIGAFLDAKSASKQFGDTVKQTDRDIANNAGMTKLSADLKKLKEQEDSLNGSDGFSLGNIPKNLLNGIQHPFGLFGGSDLDQNQAAQARIQFFGSLQDSIGQVVTAQDFMNHGFQATRTGLEVVTQSAQDYQKALKDVQDVLAGRSNARAFEQDLIDFSDRTKKIADLRAQLAEAQAKAGGKGPSPSEALRIERLSSEAQHGDSAAARKKAAEDLAALQTTIANRTSEQRKRAAEDVKRITEELKDYANTLDISTQAGIRNQAMLDQFGTNLLNAANTLDELKDNPALRAAFIDAAREKYIKMAEAFGLTAKQAEEAATKAGLLDTVAGKHVKIVIDSTGAIRVIDIVAERLRRLQRLGDLKLNLITAENIRRQGGKDGDTSTPFWSGGFTGVGGKYEPAGIVHRNEVVLPEEIVRRDWSMLRSRYGHLPGFANGGLVQPFASNVSNTYYSNQAAASGISASDLRAIAMLVANSRQLYGDVHISGDPTVYRKTLQNDHRMASSDGVYRGV